jgi:hypothetical protein
MRCHYATSAWSLRPVLTRGPLPYRGSTLPLSYGGMKLAALESDQDFRGQSAVGCHYPIGHQEPATRVERVACFLQGSRSAR